MNRKNIALIMSAGICMSGMCSNLPMSFTGNAMIGTLAADEADVFARLPHTLDEFNEFTEKYGVVSVHDNFIVYCDSVNYSTGAEVVLQQLGTAEIKEVKNYSVDELLPPGSTDHVVYVYKAVSPGTVKVSWMQGRPWQWEESKEERSLDHFEIDDELSVRKIEKNDESDIFDRLPHTLDEFNEFTEKFGVVSIHDNFIVYCDSINYSTGAEVVLQQLGTAEIEEVKHYSVDNGDEPLPPGSTDHVVYVYKAVSPGTVKVSWMQGQPWYWEESKEERGLDYFEIDDELSVRTIEEKDFVLTVRGDANGDGVFNIADAVMLQKWLLCGDELTYWQNADLYKDDKIDVFDFCLMKKELIEKSNSDYKVLETKNFYGSGNMENIKDSVFYAKDMESLLTHLNIAEVCKNENCKCDYHDAAKLIPDQIDESFFDENVAVIVYNSYGAGNKTLTIDRLESINGYLTVYTTTNIPAYATPDMTYYRSVIAVNKKYFGDTHKVIRKDTVVEE